MKKIYVICIVFVLALFGCWQVPDQKVIEGFTDEEMLNELTSKYGIEFKVVDCEQEQKYAKEESFYYSCKKWTVCPIDKPGLEFEVLNDLDKAQKNLILQDEYLQRIFYYYLKQSNLDYTIEGKDTDSVVRIYFDSEDDIASCINETCNVLKQALADSTYQYESMQDREVVGGLMFALKGIDYQCPGYFYSHRLVIERNTTVSGDTKYIISKGTYDDLSGPYDEENYNRPMSLENIEDAWNNMVGDEYERFMHDKPFIDNARNAAFKELEKQEVRVKTLNFTGATWDGLWDGDSIRFNGIRYDDSYFSVIVKYVNDEWRVKVK